MRSRNYTEDDLERILTGSRFMSDKHKEALWARIMAEEIPAEQTGDPLFVELSDDALDQAAGGMRHELPEDFAGNVQGSHAPEGDAGRHKLF